MAKGQLDGKVAIVTGGGTGVGKQTAIALLNAGYCVAIAGRRVELLEQVKSEAGAARSGMLCVRTDVADPQSVRTLFAETTNTFGRLDVLFNNAGAGSPRALLENITYEQWKSVVDVNLTGAFLCTQEAFKAMNSQEKQ